MLITAHSQRPERPSRYHFIKKISQISFKKRGIDVYEEIILDIRRQESRLIVPVLI